MDFTKNINGNTIGFDTIDNYIFFIQGDDQVNFNKDDIDTIIEFLEQVKEIYNA